MRDPERVNAVVSEWVLKAENDLKNAAHTLKLRDQCPTDCLFSRAAVRREIPQRASGR